MNECIFLGRVGKDSEIKITQNGIPVCDFSLAINKKIKENNNTIWLNMKAFGEVTNYCKIFSKGDLVKVLAEYNSYKDKNGIIKPYFIVQTAKLYSRLVNPQNEFDEGLNNSEINDDIPF